MIKKNDTILLKFLFLMKGFIVIAIGVRCGRPSIDLSLVDSKALGSPQGFRIARVITHYHSPYSYDACDFKGLEGEKLNQSCVKDLKVALCQNRVDYTFITDHPKNMAKFSIRELLLLEPKDELILNHNAPYANRIGSCDSGFKPTLLTGIEGQLLALGLQSHLEVSSLEEKLKLYESDTRLLRDRLRDEAGSLVMIPHTEDKLVDKMLALEPDGLEIYNLHANVDPKIRLKHLKVPPFRHFGILSYLLDPYNELIADFAFLGFLEKFPTYRQKWNTLISNGQKLTGIVGTDSHQNVFPQKTSDGERLDSHRKLTRLMSNYVLVNSMEIEEVKAALKLGRSWMVFEGLAVPTQMDFYATPGPEDQVELVSLDPKGMHAVLSRVFTPGDALKMTPQGLHFHITAPKLHEKTPAGKEAPIIRVALIKSGSLSEDVVVAKSVGQDIDILVTEKGAYRAEVSIVPRHLRDFLGDFSSQADLTYDWIITNHIYIH